MYKTSTIFFFAWVCLLLGHNLELASAQPEIAGRNGSATEFFYHFYDVFNQADEDLIMELMYDPIFVIQDGRTPYQIPEGVRIWNFTQLIETEGWAYSALDEEPVVIRESYSTAIVSFSFSRYNDLDEKYFTSALYGVLSRQDGEWGWTLIVVPGPTINVSTEVNDGAIAGSAAIEAPETELSASEYVQETFDILNKEKDIDKSMSVFGYPYYQIGSGLNSNYDVIMPDEGDHRQQLESDYSQGDRNGWSYSSLDELNVISESASQAIVAVDSTGYFRNGFTNRDRSVYYFVSKDEDGEWAVHALLFFPYWV